MGNVKICGQTFSCKIGRAIVAFWHANYAFPLLDHSKEYKNYHHAVNPSTAFLCKNRTISNLSPLNETEKSVL